MDAPQYIRQHEGSRSMKLFAIGDLHLPGGQEKPMDVFGRQWTDHPQIIRTAWQEVVAPADWVLVPGDISWAMHLEEARDDLAFLGNLPGRIVILRGNHDYWWHGIGKVRQALPPNVTALQNDCVMLNDDCAVCGTRGWELPDSATNTPQDEKIYEREVIRLEMSLQAARRAGAERLFAMLHFPPADSDGRATDFTRLLEQYCVEKCVYGHLHAAAVQRALRGTCRGVFYQLVSCDALGFTPYLVAEV